MSSLEPSLQSCVADYLLASQALAVHAQSYQVIRTPATDMASDHCTVLTVFDVPE
jgi:exonuclease III